MSVSANKKIYKLMMDYLDSLQDVKDINKLVHIFQIKILLLSGFRPHIDSCVKCSKKVDGKARFSMKSGGLVCPKCPTTETSFTLISKGAISTMLHIEGSEWSKCLRLGLTPTVKNELKYILNNFLVFHLEKKLRTTRFLYK